MGLSFLRDPFSGTVLKEVYREPKKDPCVKERPTLHIFLFPGSFACSFLAGLEGVLPLSSHEAAAKQAAAKQNLVGLRLQQGDAARAEVQRIVFQGCKAEQAPEASDVLPASSPSFLFFSSVSNMPTLAVVMEVMQTGQVRLAIGA